MAYIQNTNPTFWNSNHTNCNCGAFALNTTTWVSPYDNDDNYTESARHDLMQEMLDEGFDRETIMDAILVLDQKAILQACHWIEPIMVEDIQPEDKIVAYRLMLSSDAFELGEIDDDYHFRVCINGFWFEKCGQEPIQFCGLFADESPWHITNYLVYDSDVIYFRFKK